MMASPAQVSALLEAVARPELTAFFGCLYYAALRPEEAVVLRLADCDPPGSGWGMLRLAAATPRTAAAWTSDGTDYEQRGLKHRPDGTIRLVPAPPVLAAMLRAHHTVYSTTPDGRLFRGARGGPLSESVYGRAWHAARTLALSPELAASGLTRRPYDLRHAALSPVAERRGRPRPDRCPRREQRLRPAHRLQPLHPRPRRPPQPADRPRPQAVLGAWSVPVRGRASGVNRPRDYAEASGCTDHATAPVGRGRRPPYVRDFPARPADGPQITPTAGHHSNPFDRRLASSKPDIRTIARHPLWPTAGPQTVREPLAPARKSR
jgi:hypothetical protein